MTHNSGYMVRRDTERGHAYAQSVFDDLGIFDIQGLLKEGGKYQCGVEAYQVDDVAQINFSCLDTRVEKARFDFCTQLGVPYYVIIALAKTHQYQVYSTEKLPNSCLNYVCIQQMGQSDFLDWWRGKQSFEQKKPMYNAHARLSNSMIDADLFGHSLAWGVNIDGFSFDAISGKINAIYEKRICSYKPPYTVASYDPNRFFHGTATRSGDYPAWSLLAELAARLEVPLILLTFDTNKLPIVGAAKVKSISVQSGIMYHDSLRPCNNLFQDNIAALKEYLHLQL